MTTTLIALVAALTAELLGDEPEVELNLMPFMLIDLALLYLVAVHYGVLPV